MTRLPLAIVALLLWLAQPLAVSSQATNATLQGEFAVTIASEDVPPDLIDGASLIGRWTITFNADGTYLLGRQDVGPLASGQFATAGDRLTLQAETGVLACPPGETDEAAATYTWESTGNRLLLIAVEEPCARRRLLLTTRTLSVFAACPQTLASAASAADSPTGDIGTPSPRNTVSATPAAQDAPATAIDTLLRQMSDCWATRTPDRFLHLLSRDFRASRQPDNDDDARRFTLAMGAPIVWERVSDVERIDATRVAANVRQISGDTVDVVRYDFVFEDGVWRWDGAAERP